MRLVGLAFAAALILSACGSDDGRPVLDAVVSADDRSVWVSLDSGRVDGAAEVEETDDEVRITGSATEACGESADCAAASVTFRLDAPLGDRALIDEVADNAIDPVHCDRSPPE
jgi:hypothetical protein